MHQSTNHPQCFDNERSNTCYKTTHFNAGKRHGKKGKTPLRPFDRSPPEPTPAHEQGKEFVGKKQRNRRQRRIEARERRRLRASVLASVDAGTQTTSALTPTPTSTVTPHLETNHSSKNATTDLTSSCHPAIDSFSSRRDKDDDDSSAAAMAIPISDPNDDFVKIASLNELLQWLKLEATSQQTLPPSHSVRAARVVCMGANAYRDPQPQDYCKAQEARQPTRGSLSRTMRASARPSSAASDELQDDIHTREIRARDRSREKAAAKKTDQASDSGSRKTGKGKGKKSKPTPSTPPQTPKKKMPSRSNSLKTDSASATSSPRPARRNAISEASTADTTLVIACTTPLRDTSPRIEPDNKSPKPFASTRRIPTWVRDVTAPLPKSTSPTTCMISHSGAPDLKFRDIGINPWGHSKPAPKNNPFHDLDLLKEERRRNIASRRKARKEMRKAFRALQKEKALEHEKQLIDDKAAGNAAALQDAGRRSQAVEVAV